jgi:hypothetical protein
MTVKTEQIYKTATGIVREKAGSRGIDCLVYRACPTHATTFLLDRCPIFSYPLPDWLTSP